MATFRDALELQQQASPGNPPSGYTKLFFKSGDLMFLRTSAGVERQIAPLIPYAFSYTGTLAVTTGAHRLYNDTGGALTIKAVRASVGTAPTGATVVCDVKVDGTTIFSVTANRPTIAISGNTNKTTGMSTTTIADGSYFTADIVSVGSTVPGANLTVQILCG
jgi:hypothetical protein